MKKQGIGMQKAFAQTMEQQSREGQPRLNGATYTQTQASAPVLKLANALMIKNAVNRSDYPEIAAMEAYCLQEVALLFGLKDDNAFIGTSTVGSSEACYAAGLAMLFRWKNHRRAAATWRTPNLIISSAHHVCWNKFAVYHDVELREIPITLENPVLDPQRVLELIDKDTIGIVATLGGTHLGLYDDIEMLDNLLERFNERSYFPLYIHVDAASGGFYAPFTDPQYVWDFRLKNIASINVSGHKYGLVPASIGWLIWRSKEFMPSILSQFSVPYLGGEISTLGVNFSKPSMHIGVQYMLFLGLGREGYAEVQNRIKQLSLKLYRAVSKIQGLVVLNPPNHLPVICWRSANSMEVDLYALADMMKEVGGWHIPTYPLPRNMEHITIQRFVCRADLTDEMVDHFVHDLHRALSALPTRRSIG